MKALFLGDPNNSTQGEIWQKQRKVEQIYVEMAKIGISRFPKS